MNRPDHPRYPDTNLKEVLTILLTCLETGKTI